MTRFRESTQVIREAGSQVIIPDLLLTQKEI